MSHLFKIFFILSVILFSASSSLLQTQSFLYQPNIKVGDTLLYKRHEYDVTSHTWNPWSYLMYEVYSIQDSTIELEATTIKAKQWVSNDTKYWKQVPFIDRTTRLIQESDLLETGIIARLQEIPIQRFSSFQEENFVIEHDSKLGEKITAITMKINSSLDEEDWLIVESINEGFGLRITVSECGCSVEGGTSRRVRNITYTSQGILHHYYLSEKVDYGPDATTTRQEFELLLMDNFNYGNIVFENFSNNWKEEFLSELSDSKTTNFFVLSFMFTMIAIVIVRKNFR